jgi:hypothetical protein
MNSRIYKKYLFCKLGKKSKISFWNEFFFIIISIHLFHYFNFLLSTIISFILFIELIHYELFIKHQKCSLIRKLLYVIINLFHISFAFFMYYLIFNFHCNIVKLLLLDILYFIDILLFFNYKMCFLTKIENYVINLNPHCRTMTLDNIINFFIKDDYNYQPEIGDNEKHWIKGNKKILALIIIINIGCLSTNLHKIS